MCATQSRGPDLKKADPTRSAKPAGKNQFEVGDTPRDRYLKPKEVQNLLGLGKSKTYDLLKERQLPGVVKIGSSVRVRESALLSYLRELEEVDL